MISFQEILPFSYSFSMKTCRASSFRTFLFSSVLLVTVTGCKPKHESEDSAAASGFTPSAFIQSMKFNDFCSSVAYLDLYDAAFKDDVAMLCDGDQATELFEKIILGAFDQNSTFDSYPFENISEMENQRSDFVAAFALKIPKLTAIDIRESDLNRILQSDIKLDLYEVLVEPIAEAKLSGLNFLRFTQKYRTLVKGPQSTEFRNERTTERNYYQVSVQREDLALITEHLKDVGANPDYDWARTLNVVIANPEDGGSFIVSVVHFRTWNQGFHKLNTRALDAITKENARKVFQYLLGLSQP